MHHFNIRMEASHRCNFFFPKSSICLKRHIWVGCPCTFVVLQVLCNSTFTYAKPSINHIPLHSASLHVSSPSYVSSPRIPPRPHSPAPSLTSPSSRPDSSLIRHP